MVTLRLSVDDLAQTRFAISPMFELASSLRALRDPARAALHVPWIREALPIATRLDLAGAIALTPPEGYMPDFLTPPPSSPLATIEEELELVQATSEQIIREDLLTLARWGKATPTGWTPSSPTRSSRSGGSSTHCGSSGSRPCWPTGPGSGNCSRTTSATGPAV